MNTLHTFIILVGCLGLLLAGCKETTVVNELPGAGLTITSIDPEIGGPGMTVEIEGSGFSAIAAENIVTFDGITVTIEAASSTHIITAVPEGVATGPVKVRVGEETAVGPVFTLDERLAFVGEYIALDYDIRYKGEPDGIIIDTTIAINGDAKVSVDFFKSSTDLLELNFENFIGESLLQVPFGGFPESWFITVVENRSLARVSGSTFELKKTTFELKLFSNALYTFPGEFSGEGFLTDDNSILLSFTFRIVYWGTLSGEVTLERQNSD